MTPSREISPYATALTTISLREATQRVFAGGKSAIVKIVPSGSVAVTGLSDFFITYLSLVLFSQGRVSSKGFKQVLFPYGQNSVEMPENAYYLLIFIRKILSAVRPGEACGPDFIRS